MLQLSPVMLIQLQLSGLFSTCQMWLLSDTSAKLSDVIAAVVQNTERLCQCGFNAEYITDSAFHCFPNSVPNSVPNSDQQVTFRARLHETVHATSVQLIEYIQQWVNTTEISIVVQGVRLDIDMCPVAITSFRDPQCPETTQSTSVTTQTTLTMLPTSMDTTFDRTTTETTSDSNTTETTSDSNTTETTSDSNTTETTSDSTTTETTSDSTTTETALLYTTVAIVGGVVAVMIGLILAMTFIVIAVLVTKNRKHRYSMDQNVG